MARAHEDVNGVLGFEHHAVVKRNAHAATHPVARLEAASAVLDDFVGKHEQREVACCVDLGEVVRGDFGVEDRPVLDEAVRLMREAILNSVFKRFYTVR